MWKDLDPSRGFLSPWCKVQTLLEAPQPSACLPASTLSPRDNHALLSCLRLSRFSFLGCPNLAPKVCLLGFNLGALFLAGIRQG